MKIFYPIGLIKMIKLNDSIYNIKDLQSAKEAFSELCKVSIEHNENYYCCSFSNCVYSEKITEKEFENYLIDLMCSK